MSSSADVLSSVANPAPAAQQTAGSSADVLSQVAAGSQTPSVKMVSPQGNVVMASPDEVTNLQKAGHTRIEPDGSFYLQNIRGEDPLEEEKRRQRVYNALTPAERLGANKAALKDFAKTGVEAGVDTALGVTGASVAGAGLGIAGETASPGTLAATRVIGKAAGTAIRLARTPIGKALITKGLEGAGLSVGYSLAHKWLGL